MQIPIATADKMPLVLKTPTSADAPLHYQAIDASRSQLSQWMPWCHADYALRDTEEWIELMEQAASQGDGFAWLILDESQQHCLGTCGLHQISRQYRSANLGYWVRTSRAGHGIATAAASVAARYAFESLGLIRVEFVVATGNTASQRVAEKLGAVREGTLRNGMLRNDSPIDALLYSLIPGDLP